LKLSVYVSAPYIDAADVVREVHAKLHDIDIEPTSMWANEAVGPEDFTRFTPRELRLLAEKNDKDILRSHAMIVLARPSVGGEMFADARYASHLAIPTFWCGRLTLSAWRWNVVRCADWTAAISTLRGCLDDPRVIWPLRSNSVHDHVRYELIQALGLIRED
jgi:hypothetical protein